ncbi:MAG: hypothetical protein EOO75_21035 [Myxococcales bacterium]|nr:MAG: hypothetical protein EOO75_21035 [Myxococcales bacterium]
MASSRREAAPRAEAGADEERPTDLRVARDEDLQRDLDEAKRRTGIRSDTEVTRLALRMLATRAA